VREIESGEMKEFDLTVDVPLEEVYRKSTSCVAGLWAEREATCSRPPVLTQS
jgi:hypothetical protein